MFSQQAKNSDEINKLIWSLESSWIGNEPWLKDVAEEINKNYRKTRSAIRSNTNTWFHSQYRECLSYHYYNLGLTYYKLFYNNKVDLESTGICLRKCLEEVKKIGGSETNGLKNEAEKFLKVINEIYEKQIKKFTENNPLRNAQQCTILGKIEDCRAFLEQVSEYSKEKRLLEQQIQNIQLLRVINTIEDTLTVPDEMKNAMTTAQYSDFLSRVYRLSGNVSLSERYKSTASYLYKSTKSNKNSNANQQMSWKEILEEGIKEYHSSVETIISAARSVMKLNPIDYSNIKKEYIKRCLELSLEEMAECIENLAKNESSEFCNILERKLNDIKNLKDIPSPFNELQYYQTLMDHNNLISNAESKVFINEFKMECKEKMNSYVELGRKELPLLKDFINFLSTKNLSNLVLQRHLEKFCNGDATVTELLERIMNLQVSIYGEELKVLQKTIEHSKKERFTDEVVDKIKKAIEVYVKPTNMQIKKINNRFIMEVTGKNLVISEILSELNNMLLNNPEIEEVTFKGASIVHIDVNIEKDIWHGKNISIHAGKIKIHGKVVWNISGKDGEDYISNAGTDEAGQGKQGADGRSGESGGNVYISVKDIDNPEDFTIISHGGKGGKGQNGGDGKNGKDGEGIKKEDFQDKFPPVANFSLLAGKILLKSPKDGEDIKEEDFQNKFPSVFDIHLLASASLRQSIDSFVYKGRSLIRKGTEKLKALYIISDEYRRTNVRTTVKSILEKAQEIKIAYYSGVVNDATKVEVLEKIIKDSHEGSSVSGNFLGESNFTGNIFIDVKTHQGGEIIFSFEQDDMDCQAFLLYTGSDGEKGGKGGKCGLGGPGGYGGTIIITKNPKVLKIVRDGDKGQDGNPGLNGKSGKDGWDMGYMDYSISIPIIEKWPKIKGNEKNRIKLETYDSSESDRIRCSYLKF